MTASERIARAKLPRSIIAGPYGHPFHATVVTIPIGAWTASVVFDVIGLFAEDATPWAVGALALVIIGLVGGVLAAALGFFDLSVIPRGTRARSTALLHMALNLTALALFAGNAVIRAVSAKDDIPVAAFVLGLVALAGVGVSGWLGGKLAYHYGVRVADETTQAEGFVPR